MSSNNIHIIIINADEERKKFQMDQFRYLNLPYPIKYFDAYTPQTSQDYIIDKDTKIPEWDTTLCCMRSHAAAINWYVTNSQCEYGLIVEDDVSFLRNHLMERLEEIINIWKKHKEIDYISVGYLVNETSTQNTDKCEGCLKWNNHKSVNIWGTQSYLIEYNNAKKMADILHQPTSFDLRNRMFAEIKNKSYSERYRRLQADAVLPILFHQAYTIKPLGIENNSQSIILSGGNRKQIYDDILDMNDYYGLEIIKYETIVNQIVSYYS